MIIGEFTAGVRILLEKGLSRHHISEDQQFSENTQKFLFGQKMEVARRRGRGDSPGAHTTPWRGPAPGRATNWCGRPSPPLPSPLRVYHLLKNLRREEDRRKTSPPLQGGKHTERESSPAGRNLPGKFLPGGGNRRHHHRH
jgi:hypothetical protein